ncbi:hypothetical protein BD414DRAFT_321173 [Trametes punicea]|nr:hypothetical protein BD414DRAFT_321173 [Trametes punicea]
MNRASVADSSRASRRRSKLPSLGPEPPLPIPSPPLEPPPLTPAFPSAHSSQPPSSIPEPPNTPPPLTPAYPTLPPPSAPVYPQHSLAVRDASRSSRSTPDTAYHSPVSYGHSTLPAPPYHQYDEQLYSSSQDSRTSSFHRTADDPRWTYHPQSQPYPASESDRYSPASPAADARYPEPPSPVETYGAGAASHRAHLSQPQEPTSYLGHYPPRHGDSALAAAATASPVRSIQSQHPSSHRHSLAHISNPIRQHSPISTHSASPVVSQPPTPAYGHVPSSVGSYAESPPSSVSPVAPASQLPSGMVTNYSSYESSSLASAGYTHPPPLPTPPSTQSQLQTYDRALPSLSSSYTRDSQQPSLPHPHLTYAQGPAFHAQRRTSPPPVLAPIQDSRVVRRDISGANEMGMRYASPPQGQSAVQSLASVSRSSGHAFSYPATSHPHPHSHSPTYAQTSASYGAVSSGSASASAQTPADTHPNVHGSVGHAHSSSSAYYYAHAGAPQTQGQMHSHLEASAEPVERAAEQYTQLHQPQPQRIATGHANHHHYVQTGPVLGGGQTGPSTHAQTWRAEDYRGRGGLVQ